MNGVAKVNALPAHAFGRLQSLSGGAPQVAPVRWADVDIMPEVYIVPERSEGDAARVATAGRGV